MSIGASGATAARLATATRRLRSVTRRHLRSQARRCRSMRRRRRVLTRLSPIPGLVIHPRVVVGSSALGQDITFTFQVVGTKYVTLTAKDAAGRTGSVEHSVVVTSQPAPASTAASRIGGTDQQSDTLTVSNGSWSRSPSSCAYEWQDCDSSGASCATVSGATASVYTLGSGDVGHTVRAVVTAKNASGATPASSSPTSVVSSGSSGLGSGGSGWAAWDRSPAI